MVNGELSINKRQERGGSVRGREIWEREDGGWEEGER